MDVLIVCFSLVVFFSLIISFGGIKGILNKYETGVKEVSDDEVSREIKSI